MSEPLLHDADLASVRAFADGELAPAEHAALERRLATEPALAAALAREQALRRSLRDAYDDVLDEPVPDALTAWLTGASVPSANDGAAPRVDGVVDLAAARRARARDLTASAASPRPWRWAEWGGLAAALVMGVTLGGRWLASPADPAERRAAVQGFALDAKGRLVAGAPLARVLEAGRGGTTVAGTSVGLTFQDRDGRWCRTFATGTGSANAGIACAEGGRGAWTVAWLDRGTPPAAAPASAPMASAPGDEATYRTAASAFPPALLAAVDAMRAGDTVDAAGEDAARASGWHASAPR